MNMPISRPASGARIAAGFTLVEVMIALLIGMIGIIVMMQVFSVSEGFKRTTTGSSDAQVNGAVAMYMIEREIRTSGYNMNEMIQKGCPSVRLWWNAGNSGVDVHMFPVEMNPAIGLPVPDANTDVLQVAFGTADSSISGIPASQLTPADPTSPFKLQNATQDTFKSGDMAVAVQPGAGPGGSAVCWFNEITKVYQPSGNCGQAAAIGTLEHGTAPYLDSYKSCNVTQPTHNAPPPGILQSNGTVIPPLDSSKGGALYNLGGFPVIHVWMVRGGNLVMCDWGQKKDCTNAANYDVMVNDIVSLRAVYAIATTPADLTQPPDMKTVVWNRNPITGGASLTPTRVVAIAFQLTARSGLKEKPKSGTTCDATPNPNRPDASLDWMYQSLAGAGIDLSQVSADWNCYRYKMFQTRVPVRNTIWRP